MGFDDMIIFVFSWCSTKSHTLGCYTLSSLPAHFAISADQSSMVLTNRDSNARVFMYSRQYVGIGATYLRIRILNSTSRKQTYL